MKRPRQTFGAVWMIILTRTNVTCHWRETGAQSLSAKSREILIDMTRKITVCTTCKLSPQSAFDDKGQTGGELMLKALQDAATSRGDTVAIEPQECLWSCEQSCSVLLQDSEKISYLTGKFSPDAEAANTILDWFALHGQSEDGNVPLEQWPKAMYSHFIARIPPLVTQDQKP